MSPAGPLDVILVNVDDLHEALEGVEAQHRLMSADEIAWTSPAPAELRRKRRTTRIALRLALAKAGASGARGRAFVTGQDGKPHLLERAPHFSVSHTGSLALIVICYEGQVGGDIEAHRTVQLASSRQALIVAAAEGMGAGPGEPFLGAWTRLEAFAKARGTGIGALLTELGITAAGVSNLKPDTARQRARDILDAAQSSVWGLGLPAGLHGAVAGPSSIEVQQPAWRQLSLDECMLD